MIDEAAELWRRAVDIAADEEARERAADCLALTLVEAAISAREPSWRRYAKALAVAPGRATVAGARGTFAAHDAAVANAFLVHANLADDSYRVAAHPGLPVISTAISEAEEAGVAAATFLTAVLGGYEVACTLADLLLPEIADRGFRVTAVIAPAAAAATWALVRGVDDRAAVDALRLALAGAGGVLGVVDAEGDGWRLQPALATLAGVAAARAAAAGARGPAGILERANGVHATLVGGEWPGLPPSLRPRILDVTFKRYGVAMYGQAIYDALEGRDLSGSATCVTVEVAPFAAGYGRQQGANTRSVASVRGIALDALTRLNPALAPLEPEAVRVVAADDLAPLEARIRVKFDDGSITELWGSGDTSGWNCRDVEAHAVRRAGDMARTLVRACRLLDRGGALDDVVAAWRPLW